MAMPGPEQIAYMQAHASDNLSPNVIVCCSVCAFLAAVFVAARLFARLLSGKFILADWLIIFSFCFYIPFCVCLALCAKYGLGKHVIFATDARLLQIYFISSEVIYSIVIVTIKWSILAFYNNIFPQQWFRHALLGVAVFMGAWMITTVFAILFQCTPFEFNWDTTIPGGHCINIGQFALVTSILNVLTDVAILILPLPLVFQLKVSKQKQWNLAFLFALGGGACVVGITRAAWIGKLNATVDPTWDNVPAAYLSAIEILAGFLVSCIPSYPVLFFRATGRGGSSKRSRPSGKQTPGGSGESGSAGKSDHLGTNKFLARRPVVSWNALTTNNDDIGLVSQVPANHQWTPVPEEHEAGDGGHYHYGDADQASTKALNQRPGVAV